VSRIDLVDVARYPLPGTLAPGSIRFMPDDGAVTWLHSPEGTLSRELFAVDVATGERRPLVGDDAGVQEGELTIEEKLRRERMRELATGVTRYEWSETGGVLVVPLASGLWVGDRLVDVGGGPVLDPQVSPDGRWVAFVQDDELHVVATDGASPPRQLTEGARGTGRTNGLAEFVAQEEMGRLHGFWWSRDSRHLAFQETDETHIPVYRIVHQGSGAVGDGAQEDHRYPFAGAGNAHVRLGVVDVDVDGGDVRWLDLGDGFEYLARVDWFPDGSLVVQLEDRAQSRLDVVKVDVDSGARTVLLTETSDVWVNLHDLLRPLDDGTGRFLWASERMGYLHLEVREAGGALSHALTGGEWVVTSVDAVGDGKVWFTATRDSPLERHLYVVPIDGDRNVGVGIQRVTHEAGTHDVVIDHARRRFVDTWSSLTQPPVVRLCDLATGAVERVLFDAPDPRLDELQLEPPELTTVTADDGTTELHALVYRPDGDAPFRTVVSVYGGPHAQRVTDSWGPTVRMRDQYLRQLGYLVVTVDNRGSNYRGLAFEGAIRHLAGDVEVRDQVSAVRQLAERGLVDVGTAGVAVHGWSYGGYMAAMLLATAGDVFTVAVSGAPVTHWDGYDTHYTERYMGLPSENADGYERSSVLAHVDGMRDGKLLLVHGLIDENVHFRHTARLVNALIAARIPYQLLLFPDERHTPRREGDRVFMEEQLRDFLVANLPP
jgi:dipeptidyl-peptidase-4